jgi:hypothetical protein
MTMMKGGWGRVIWFPTFDAENQVRYSGEKRPFVSVSRGGRLLPEVLEVIAVAARHGLTVETGHSSPEEGLMIVREAHRQGVAHIVVTHAMLPPVRMNVAQMREAAREGAFLEFVYNGLFGPNKSNDMREYAEAIRQVGPAHCILASDLGQAGNPLHPDGLAAFFAGLMREGISETDVQLMSGTNPAKAIGLEK